MIPVDYTKYKSLLRLKKVTDKKTNETKKYIFCLIRNKWLVLQPEELVRQLILHYLIEEKGYSKNSITVEKGITVNELSRRCDILVFDENTKPILLVECKSPRIKITEAVFQQIAAYNLPLQVKYLLLSNGSDTYCCEVNHKEKSWHFLEEIPKP